MGHTPALPLRLTGPTPTQVRLVALALVQVKVAAWPWVMEAGVAVSVTEGAPPEVLLVVPLTVTVTLAD